MRRARRDASARKLTELILSNEHDGKTQACVSSAAIAASHGLEGLIMQSAIADNSVPDWLSAMKENGVMVTRKRATLLDFLFRSGNRHLTARHFHEQAAAANINVSLATVYNTLKLASDCGLVREVTTDPGTTYFDTNVARHNHIFFEDSKSLIDSPCDEWAIGELPIPDGYELVRVDLTVRLNPIKAAS